MESTRRSFWVVIGVLALIGAACTGGGEGADPGGGEEQQIEVGPNGFGAVITRTSDGVPHVHAADVPGVSFGQGWASAEDHPCDLVDQILEVHSQRASALGPGEEGEYVEGDFGWAALGIVERANADWEQVAGDERDLIEGFAAGWNASFEEQGADGIEDWCTGAGWLRPITPEELYTYARTVTLLASGARLIDFIASAQPPGAEPAGEAAEEAAAGTGGGGSLASNGWAVGSELSESGGGLLVGNPHFPWIGELRFSEVHLSTDDGMDVYGAQLLGLPGVGVGFTEGVAWTHTVSAGKRFTAYEMDLVPGDPTSYLMDGEAVAMDSEEITIEVLGEDGATTEQTRTYYSTEFGPVIDFPGIGWNGAATASYRDANFDNDRLLGQYLDMNRADSLEELRAAHEEHQGIPLFNTIAVDADGTTWYADTSATPDLSPEAISAYEERLEAGGLTKLAAASRAVLLEGHTSRDRWVEDPEAPWPGVLPFSSLPTQQRDDYVMNANDSYWIANAAAPIEGDYSPLQGSSETARSVRTRQNLSVLQDTGEDGSAGEDGLFSLEDLMVAALDDGAYTESQWREGVVARCGSATGPVPNEELFDSEGQPVVAAGLVDIGPACEALAGWGGRYDTDSTGAVVWREFTEQVDYETMWAEPFDAGAPGTTPSGLAPAPAQGTDQVMTGLANAVALLGQAGIPLDVALGEVQYDGRVAGSRTPIPGGLGSEGVTNVVSDGRTSASTTEERPEWPDRLVDGSTLTADGYPITYGTSFLMAVGFGPDGPEGHTILTYGQVGDPSAPGFDAGVEAFSVKRWKPALFDTEAIEADSGAEVTVVAG